MRIKNLCLKFQCQNQSVQFLSKENNYHKRCTFCALYGNIEVKTVWR